MSFFYLTGKTYKIFLIFILLLFFSIGILKGDSFEEYIDDLTYYLFNRKTNDYITFLQENREQSFSMGNGLNYMGMRYRTSNIPLLSSKAITLSGALSANFSFSVFSEEEPPYSYEPYDLFAVLPGAAVQLRLDISDFFFSYTSGILYWSSIEPVDKSISTTIGTFDLGYGRVRNHLNYQLMQGVVSLIENIFSLDFNDNSLRVAAAFHNGWDFSNDVYYAELYYSTPLPTGLIVTPSLFHISPDIRDYMDQEGSLSNVPDYELLGYRNIGAGIEIAYNLATLITNNPKVQERAILQPFADSGYHSYRGLYAGFGLYMLYPKDTVFEKIEVLLDYRFGINDYKTFIYLSDTGTFATGESKRASLNHQFSIAVRW